MTRGELDRYLRKKNEHEQPEAIRQLNNNEYMRGMRTPYLNYNLKNSHYLHPENGSLKLEESYRNVLHSRMELLGEEIAFVKNSRFSSVPEHSHDYYELMFMYSGSIGQSVGGKRFRLSAGDFLLIAPGTMHSIDTCGEDDLIINYLIMTEHFDSIIGKNRDIAPAFSRLYGGRQEDRWCYVELPADSEQYGLMLLILCNYFDPDTFSRPVIHNTTLSLLAQLAREYTYANDTAVIDNSRRDDMRWSKIMRYIEVNGARASLTEAAKRFNYSPNYLGEIIQKQFGYSFIEIKHQLCMKQASLLILEGELSITEVAKECGFVNMRHFYDVFKKHFEVTPAEYRNRLSGDLLAKAGHASS